MLRLPDLDGRILTIERSLSAGNLGPTKSGRTRRLTLATGTVEMIQRHVRAWEARVQPELDDTDVADDLDRVLNGLDPRCRT